MATAGDWSSSPSSSWNSGGGGMQFDMSQMGSGGGAPQSGQPWWQQATGTSGGVGLGAGSMPQQIPQTLGTGGNPAETGMRYGMPAPQNQTFGMWGAPQGGMSPQQQPYGGGYGGMPYGSPYGGYGGGMPYGGGYGMQAPGGAPGGYGGWSPQQMMMGAAPQQMMKTGGAQANQAGTPPTQLGTQQQGGNTTGLSIDPGKIAQNIMDMKLSGGMSQNVTHTPWEPLGNRYEYLWGRARKELEEQQKQGPSGFDPSSEAGLKRMEQLAGYGNPFFAGARDAVTGITSGQNRIGTGGMYGQMYEDPGITGMGQYQDMARQNAVGTGRFEDLYRAPGVATKEYNDLAHQNAVGLGNYQNILQGAGGPGSLAGGMFGEVARGDRVDSNPYREKAIQQAMGDTADQVKATMSARGRYGSDAYGDAMGKALGNVATTARMQGYDTDTANMMAAAQARSGEDLARQGVGLQAAGGIAGAQSGNYAGRLAAMQGLTGAQSANIAQKQAAAQSLAGIQGQNYQAKLGALGQMNQAQQMAQQQRLAAAQGLTGVQAQNLQNRMQAAGMAPAMNNLRYDDAQRMMQAGAAREAMEQQQRNFDWGQLGQYRGMLGNLPGAAGQTQSESQKPWWETALGLGASAAGMIGGMGGGG